MCHAFIQTLHIIYIDRAATRVIYNSPASRPVLFFRSDTPPVVLVTAERDAGLRQLAAERGWGMMAKPVKPPALRALMSQLLIRHRG
ncbi:hypothetical protein DI494_14270 [Stenotrophomonas maltophilia]|nr:hypothetical protein DI494_14270 [Stenotrophomonas maltophilia]